MNGAIFFSGQYGSTAQYARWVSDATGLPIFDVRNARADPADFDFLVLGSSVIVHKLTIRHWVKHHLQVLLGKPVILFTVSGAPAGAKLDDWIARSLPATIVEKARHFALRGRLDHDDIGWWSRLILRIGAWMNDDPDAANEELHGFDFMDRTAIVPVVESVRRLQ